MQNEISIFTKLHNILRIFINIKNITIVMIGVSFSGGSTYYLSTLTNTYDLFAAWILIHSFNRAWMLFLCWQNSWISYETATLTKGLGWELLVPFPCIFIMWRFGSEPEIKDNKVILSIFFHLKLYERLAKLVAIYTQCKQTLQKVCQKTKAR